MPAPDTAHLDRLGGFPPRSIFIAGTNRSGTTWLHRLLSTAADVDHVSFYDVVERASLIEHRLRGDEAETIAAIDAELARFGSDRGIDPVRIGALEPEEYAGVMRRSYVGLDSRHPYSNPNLAPLRILARKKCWLASRPRPLLLKNPIDTCDGVHRLAEAIPNASFVFVHRHPRPVMASSVHMWQEVLTDLNPWLASLDRGYRVLFSSPDALAAVRSHCGTEAHVLGVRDRIRTAMFHFLDMERTLPEDRVVSVRYEDLCASPEAELERVLRELRLEAVGSVRDAARTPRASIPDPLIERIHDESIESWRPYLRRVGYADLPDA